MTTSERLSAWLIDFGLYDEFWVLTNRIHLHTTETISAEKYQELAIEFLKGHLASLSGIFVESTGRCYLHSGYSGTLRTSSPPEPQTYTTTGEVAPDFKPACSVCGSSAPHDSFTIEKPEPDEERRKIQRLQSEHAQVLREKLEQQGVEVKCALPKKKPTDLWGAPIDTRGYPEK